MASKTNGRRSPDGAERSGAPSGAAARPDHPDTEVLDKGTRRRFSAADKLRVVEEADACRDPGSVAALLRREGLYSSHLTAWRRARREGALGALARRRGPSSRRGAPLARENDQLRRENARLRQRLQQAEMIVEIQKKVSEILGIPLSHPETGDAA